MATSKFTITLTAEQQKQFREATGQTVTELTIELPQRGFRRSRTLIPTGSRTAFRDVPEHHRSVATLAF